MMSHALHGSHQESNPGQVVTKRLLFDFSEENSTIPDVGADMLLKTGRLEHLKKGPVYWMDSADTNPRIGEHKCHAT